MLINKYSSPEEVTAHYEGVDPCKAMETHISRFYPEFNPMKLSPLHLQKAIRTLSTKAMEKL